MAIKIRLFAVAIVILAISACQESSHQNQTSSSGNNAELDSSKADRSESKNKVYVTAIETDAKDGDSAAYNGTLNVINGCLFIDDMLIVVANPNLEWQQDPFIIHNKGNSEKFKLGDVVTVGGSSNNYSIVNQEDIKWKNSPNSNCKSKRVWLTGNMVRNV